MLEESNSVTEFRYAVLLIMTHFATMPIFHVSAQGKLPTTGGWKRIEKGSK